MNLQGIGTVSSQAAATLKVGDVIVWNYGTTNTVESITGETAKFITFALRAQDGELYSRRLKKDREVCVA